MNPEVDEAEAQEPHYHLARADADGELARLRLLERLQDPDTLRRIDRIGVGEGWRCLELGAGAGSVTRALADRVGESGRVVAADMDPRFLAELSLANVEVEVHDIMDGPVAPGGFDFVHCRAVLTHVVDMSLAVRNLIASARPGAWVCFEEPEYVSMQACDPDHPRTSVFEAFVGSMHHGSRMDTYAGRHAYEAVCAAGLEDIEAEGVTAIVAGGDPRAAYRRLTMENVRDRALASGNYDPQSFDGLLAVFDDPSFRYIDNLWVGIIGRVPH